MKSKTLLISFLLSLPFWLFVNIFADNLEDFYFWNEISENPEILTAQAVADIDFLKLKREKQKNSIEIFNDELDLNTKSAFSVEIDEQGGKEILFEKNSQEKLAIASLTKLMTALIVFDLDETYNFSLIVPITKEAVEQEGVSRYGELKEGQFFTVETLVNVMLIESSNDAAYALAQLIGQDGSVDPFIDLMNIYVEKIGLENTRFFNVTGLDIADDNISNISTAQDIAKLSEYILNNEPEIFEITAKTHYEVYDASENLHHYIPQNTNELLADYDNVIGGKTGWSVMAKGCLLLILRNPKNNSYIINVILGAYDRFEEMKKLIKLTN